MTERANDICFGSDECDDGLGREESAAAMHLRERSSGYQFPNGVVSSIPVVSLGNESDDSSENTIRQLDETQWFSANDCDQIERWRPQPQEASMGPRLFSVDDLGTGNKARRTRPTLQWGHAYSAWMTISTCWEKVCRLRLQWGHAYSAWMTRSI